MMVPQDTKAAVTAVDICTAEAENDKLEKRWIKGGASQQGSAESGRDSPSTKRSDGPRVKGEALPVFLVHQCRYD